MTDELSFDSLQDGGDESNWKQTLSEMTGIDNTEIENLIDDSEKAMEDCLDSAVPDFFIGSNKNEMEIEYGELHNQIKDSEGSDLIKLCLLSEESFKNMMSKDDPMKDFYEAYVDFAQQNGDEIDLTYEEFKAELNEEFEQDAESMFHKLRTSMDDEDSPFSIVEN